MYRRLREVEQSAGQSAGGQRQRVRNARDEQTGAPQNAGAQLVHGVQLELGGRPVAVVDEDGAGIQCGTSVGDGPAERRQRTPSSQRVRGLPAGRRRTGRFGDRVQKTHDRVETQHVLQERAVLNVE